MKSITRVITRLQTTQIYRIDDEEVSDYVGDTVNDLVWNPVWNVVRGEGITPLRDHIREEIK